ncbi:MAG: hypothetical protein EPN84_07495 [Legionella sp.]|nr:MAG: hypothetical protein EPN84_07495 [Legionella sp.]
MDIRVISSDVDGCLFNPNYFNKKNNEGEPNPTFLKVIEANKALLDSWKKENENYSKSILMVGSNRQSKPIDDNNQCDLTNAKKDSCFPAFIQIAQELGMDLYRFLLADIYGFMKVGYYGLTGTVQDLTPGTSFNLAISPEKDSISHACWAFDETKATLLYGQIHHIANTHPDDNIVFDFYDDRGNKGIKDILEWLNDFYGQYPELIPDNVTLRLHHYEGNEVTKIAKIPGKGFIDSNYYQTVRDMAQISILARQGTKRLSSYIHSAHHVKPELLKNRKPLKVKPESESKPVESPAPKQESAASTASHSSSSSSSSSTMTWTSSIKETVQNYHLGDATRFVLKTASNSKIADATRNLIWGSGASVVPSIASVGLGVSNISLEDFTDLSSEQTTPNSQTNFS